MANKTIMNYSTAGSIDAAADYFLLYQNSSNTYRRINRNTLMGSTGTPVTTTASQSLTNKTLDNTNTITVRDDRFTLQDNADTTKQAVFELSSITTGTTRTFTFPNASSTLVGAGAVQTLTNKTLTSPTINGGTISNSSIAVDAIAEFTPANGVTVDGLNLKDGKLNTNNSVVTANITDSAVTPAKLQTGTGSGWAWQSWSPTWTNFTTTSATIVGKYTQIGKQVMGVLSCVFGGSTAITGTAPTFTLPVTAAGTGTYPAAFVTGVAGSATFPIGGGTILDAGTAAFNAAVYMVSSGTAKFVTFGAGGTYTNTVDIQNSVPMTWTNGDNFALFFSYEAA